MTDDDTMWVLNPSARYPLVNCLREGRWYDYDLEHRPGLLIDVWIEPVDDWAAHWKEPQVLGLWRFAGGDERHQNLIWLGPARDFERIRARVGPLPATWTVEPGSWLNGAQWPRSRHAELMRRREQADPTRPMT